MLSTIVAFVLVLGFLILIHEGGHFFAARLARVWVHEFAVGFGPALWRRKTRETLYALRLIPVGGYVRMAGELEPGGQEKATDAAEVPSERLFSAKSPWARLGIIVAGPLTNIVGAIVLMVLVVWAFGSPYVQVLDFVSPDSPAAQALQPGDLVLAIDGRSITSISQIQNAVAAAGERPLTITVLRDGRRLSVQVTPEWVPEQERFLIGARFTAAGQTNRLSRVSPEAPLAALGLQAGDRIVAVDEVAIHSAFALGQALQARQGAGQVVLTVLRGERRFTVTLEMSAVSLEALFQGVAFEIPTRSLGFLGALQDGVRQTWNLTLLLYRGIWGIVTGRIAAGEAFSGPVGIANILGQGLAQGWLPFFQLVAILSLNLGILNLLPFPALDGSRLLFITLELVRGRPISPRLEGIIHQVGFVILLGLILLITFNDILKLIR